MLRRGRSRPATPVRGPDARAHGPADSGAGPHAAQQPVPAARRFAASGVQLRRGRGSRGGARGRQPRRALARRARDRGPVARAGAGLSLTHSSCPLQKALRDLREPRRTHCRRWKRDVFAWFAAHPEVETVFVAGLTGGSGVVARPGRSRFETSVQGYADAWRALPATVRTIVVIRDTPKMARRHRHLRAACRRRRPLAGQRVRDLAGPGARPRPGDGGRRTGCATPRVRTVDLTPLLLRLGAAFRSSAARWSCATTRT